jgi:hypothetical protein
VARTPARFWWGAGAAIARTAKVPTRADENFVIVIKDKDSNEWIASIEGMNKKVGRKK